MFNFDPAGLFLFLLISMPVFILNFIFGRIYYDYGIKKVYISALTGLAISAVWVFLLWALMPALYIFNDSPNQEFIEFDIKLFLSVLIPVLFTGLLGMYAGTITKTNSGNKQARRKS